MKRTITSAAACIQLGITRGTLFARRAELGVGKLHQAGGIPYWLFSTAEVRKLAECRPDGYKFGRPRGAKNLPKT
jgi:hypothetical protein